MIKRPVTDIQADKSIFAALILLLVAVAVPGIGVFLQFILIGCLMLKCDVKFLPALLICILGRGNFPIFHSGAIVLRLGITLGPSSMLVMTSVFFAAYQILTAKYDNKTMFWGFLWLLAAIPAFHMTLEAKSNGVVGFWSAPFIDWCVPGLYFWGVSMGNTYASGSKYLFNRLVIMLAIINALMLANIVYIWSFFIMSLSLAFFYFCLFNKNVRGAVKFWAWLGCAFAMGNLIFARALSLSRKQGFVDDVDKYGSTFSTMGVVALCLLLAWVIKSKVLFRSVFRLFPIGAVISIVMFLSWAINTKQAGENAEIVSDARTMTERWNAKLFGDRANVWAFGWEEVKTPPYIFKDLRAFQVYKKGVGLQMKLLPHNQFLTLLGRYGFWLGLYLSLWIIMVWNRAMGVLSQGKAGSVMAQVYLPVGFAIFSVVGLTGQSVTAGDLWGNALVCIVLPGVLYGSVRANGHE